MLFGGCNCIADAATLGALCAGGAGFVTAMMAAMAAGARTAEATPLGRRSPRSTAWRCGSSPTTW